MKCIKKNQILIYVFVLILMVAGYLNYKSNTDEQLALEATTELADIGDATLVNSNDMVQSDNTINQNAVTQNTITEDNVIETSTENSSDYFVQSKLERDSMYSQMLETYNNILNSDNSLETQRQSATEEIKKINNIKNGIMICENLIKTKGFENSVIFVNGDSINVIVGATELKQEEIAQIQNIITRELNTKIENIHILNKF